MCSLSYLTLLSQLHRLCSVELKDLLLGDLRKTMKIFSQNSQHVGQIEPEVPKYEVTTKTVDFRNMKNVKPALCYEMQAFLL